MDFFSSLEEAGAELHTFQGRREKTALQVERKPIKACNKNDKRLFIKEETEKVNIYHFGFYLVDLETLVLPRCRNSESIGKSQCNS